MVTFRAIRIRIVGQDLADVSSSDSLPASTSCIAAVAVNILFIEPLRNWVSSVFGVRDSRLERPAAAEDDGDRGARLRAGEPIQLRSSSILAVPLH